MATGPYMDQAVDRVAMPGPILAHVLHDFNVSRGDCDGVLFGHLEKTTSQKFEDDDELSGMREELTAVVTGFFCCGSVSSFHDACGRIIPSKLRTLLSNRGSRGGDPLIGWFSGRHNTPMRPSLREAAVTRCLRLSGQSSESEGFANQFRGDRKGALIVSDPSIPLHPTRDASAAAESPSGKGESSFQNKENQTILGRHLQALGGKAAPIDLDSHAVDVGVNPQPMPSGVQKSGTQASSLVGTLQNSGKNAGVSPSSPCLFMLITEAGAGQAVHTQEYRVYQYHIDSQVFVPRTLKIANIGPAFRVQYDSFSPVTSFPLLFCGTEEKGESNSSSTGSNMKQKEPRHVSRRTRSSLSKEQMLLDAFSEGYCVERLASLANPDGPRQVSELEDLYSRMLIKLETLAKCVCETSSALIQQEKANKQLRIQAASLE